MPLDERISELASAKLVQLLAPELVVLLELQVFNRNLLDVPCLAELEDVMIKLIELKMDFVFAFLLERR